MAIKIPGAAEVGLGRRTPGAIPAGLPRPVREIPGIGLEVAQAVTRFAGVVVREQAIKKKKLVKAQRDEAVSKGKIITMGLQASLVRSAREIAAREDLDIEGKQGEFGALIEKTRGEFSKNIPDELQSLLAPSLEQTGFSVKEKFDVELTRQVNDRRMGDMDRALLGIETFSDENPGYEKDTKAQAHILIDASPLDATQKIARKRSIDRVIDSNAVKNELVLGDPAKVLDRLQEKTESGAFANYRGLRSADRTLYTSQARDAVAIDKGIELANEIYDKDGPQTDNDLGDRERMIKSVESRTSPGKKRDAATTRIRELDILHNQARTARIVKSEAAIWEAFDGGATSTDIYEMPEFVGLPAENRQAIEKELVNISERLTKKETFALKMAQLTRFEELSDDAVKLRNTDLMAEVRSKKITEAGFNALNTMQEMESLKSIQAKAAFKTLSEARTDGVYNPDDPVDNDRQYAEFTEQLQNYILANPEGDPFIFVDAILMKAERSFKEKVRDLWFGAPGKAKAFERKQERLKELITGKTLDRAAAQRYLNLAGGDKVKARELARKDGFIF